MRCAGLCHRATVLEDFFRRQRARVESRLVEQAVEVGGVGSGRFCKTGRQITIGVSKRGRTKDLISASAYT